MGWNAKSYLVGVLLGTTVLSSIPAQAESKWGPHIDLEGKLGTDRNIGEADLFMPLWQDDDTLLFGNFRGRLDDNDSHEGNYGIGLRQMLDNGWNLGGYTYFDHRKSPYGNSFNQITVGAEALSFDWDLRANAYLPVGQKAHAEDSLDEVSFSGGGIMYRAGEERALRGFDAEIGWRVPVFGEDAGQQLRLYAGGYRFTEDEADTVQGPRGRLDLTFDAVPFLWEGSRLTLGAEVQHDSPRGTQSFAQFRLRIPLQIFSSAPKTRLTAMEKRMADPVIRDVDIVSQAVTTGAAEEITKTADGQTLAVVDSAATTGNDLAAAVAAAGANSTVILNGAFSNVTTRVDLQQGQTLMGAGSVDVKTPSGKTVTIATPGGSLSGTGTVTTSGGNYSQLIGMADNSSLIGVTAHSVASGTTAALTVTIDNATGVTIQNNTLSSNADSNTSTPVHIINGSSNITVTGNTLSANGTTGHEVIAGMASLGTNTLVFSNNSITASGTGNHRSQLLQNTTGLSGSGNVTDGSNCRDFGGNTGSISFTNGTTCP
ncbi:inverse autotransporter beta domain-containing protein [Aestuariispira ectoiniformans]|uniref:inverse autotransporter beta domain-containing protein n=1 Tax=Aestuariispira ectoiniformans TaxID=2775080 RepID=UPI00223B3EA3|nr:inverse autotransporter beta domain-containing protein [Aestuariispira ectoiniformans]